MVAKGKVGDEIIWKSKMAGDLASPPPPRTGVIIGEDKGLSDPNEKWWFVLDDKNGKKWSVNESEIIGFKTPEASSEQPDTGLRSPDFGSW